MRFQRTSSVSRTLIVPALDPSSPALAFPGFAEENDIYFCRYHYNPVKKSFSPYLNRATGVKVHTSHPP